MAGLLLGVALLLGGCAAQKQWDRGRAALGSGDPVAARYHYEQALTLDPELADKDEFARQYLAARRDAAVVEGDSALERGSPRLAIEKFGAALGIEPGWGPAEAGLAAAHGSAADQSYADAVRQADAGDLDKARELVDEALRFQSDHPAASRAAEGLSTQPEAAPLSFRRANEAVAQQRWRDAVALLRETVESEPDFLQARAAIPATLDRAAADLLARGRAALKRAEFAEAEAAFRRVAEFRPGHDRIESSLAEVDVARGDYAIADQLPGLALLHYRNARQHYAAAPETLDDSPAVRGIDTATNLLLAPLTQALSVSFEYANSPTTDPYAPTLLAAARSQLARDGRAALELTDDGTPVVLRIVGLDVPPPTQRSEVRSHAYDVEDRIPNPRVPDLERDLWRAEVRVSNLEQRLRSMEYRYDRTVSGGNADRIRYVGEELRDLRREVFAAEREISRIEWALRSEPEFLTRIRTELWPYTLNTHERSASLIAAYRIANGEPARVTARFKQTDTSIVNARPDLGLAEDKMELTPEAEVREQLAREAGRQLGDDLKRIFVQRRLDRLAEQATATTADAASARESRVAAAVLLRAIDAKEADRRLVEEQAALTQP